MHPSRLGRWRTGPWRDTSGDLIVSVNTVDGVKSRRVIYARRSLMFSESCHTPYFFVVNVTYNCEAGKPPDAGVFIVSVFQAQRRCFVGR